MLIANDTGIPHESVWKWLEDHVSHLDIVVADCTMELLDCRNDHMGGKDALEFHDRLQEMGIITTGTRYVMNHFSHNGGALHAEMGAYFNPYGIEVGYAFFLNKNVTIEPAIYYDQSFKNHSDYSKIGFKLGLGVYL